jgi:ABC-type Na+ efflux pump permease subunit
LKLVPRTAEIAIQVEPPAFLLILAVSVLAAIFFASLFMVAAASAQTYREGQAALLPYYFASIILGLSAAMTHDPLTVKQALIPVANIIAVFKSALRGEYPAGPIAAAGLSLSLLAAAAFFVAVRIGLREEAPWGTSLGIARLFGRGRPQGSGTVGSREISR